MNRIDRLTAILVQLQSKRVVKAEEIADRFEISLRTVYRDVKALMEAGVPIGSEAGKGYFIVDGYHLPPVMFTQDEASAMLLAGKLVEKMTDNSIRQAFESSLLKIKAVLNATEKDHLEDLHAHIEVRRHPMDEHKFPNDFLTGIQRAVVAKDVVRIEYFSSYNEESTQRDVEPIGLVYYSGAWHLIAWCRLRNGYRDFRADRIKNLSQPGIKFDGRNLISLQEYLASMVQGNQELQKVIVQFDASAARYLNHAKYFYGFVSEESVGAKLRMTFLTAHLKSFCRWLLTFGASADLEFPESAKDTIVELVEELTVHYGQQVPSVS
ncbi:helix-turn-helix transcriptional regulator [Chryseolinea lacunae]|uniref:YafY family transcriptional regulator n=1 Tax=Chryseolinea lacunae TaxID=2801331 RepID=A0ABS1KTN9_9BACT|nr:YafY family protein [Chryseolinea lacunae]MBL0742673.1 YafY family transcriptional regulator [Chryseolinea lacunae]